MNGAHFHLLVNHFPIIFPFAGLFILVAGHFTKSEPIKRSAFMIFILGSLFTIAAMASGENAEEVAENISGITESSIHLHEESAELFAILSYILGALSASALWTSWKQKAIAQKLTGAVFIICLITLFLAKQVGTSGGEIRHTEIRSSTNTPAQQTNESEDDD